MRFFLLFTRGSMLGITAVIPGVSIGTMALVLDVYEKCIEHTVAFLKISNWRDSTRLKNALLFLFPLFLGVLMSMFFVSKILLALFEQNRIFLQCVFLGMICGSIPHLCKNYIFPLHKGRTWLWFCVYWSIGFMMMYLLGSGESISQEKVVFFSLAQAFKAFLYGTVAAAAGVIPGISGSYTLLLMGYYETFLYIISAPVLSLLVFFLAGSILGFIVIAFSIHLLFRTFPAFSYAIVLGIVISSLLRMISVEQIALLTLPQLLIAIACVFCGILFITVITALQNTQVKKM